MGKYKKLLKRVEKIEKHISENTEVVINYDDILSIKPPKKFSELTNDEVKKWILNKNELTELPENWSIAVTEENKEYLKKYLHNDECIFYNMFYKVTIGSYFSFMSGNNCGHSQKYNTEDYTEITFDQFKKWVLKEDESKVVESDHLKEIDWSKPGQLVENEYRYVMLTSGKHKGLCFSGTQLKKGAKNIDFIGSFYDNIRKEGYKLCTEPITLSN